MADHIISAFEQFISVVERNKIILKPWWRSR
jgi:hypothetical protein